MMTITIYLEFKVGGLTECQISSQFAYSALCKQHILAKHVLARGFGGISQENFENMSAWEALLTEYCEAVNVVLATCTVTKYATLGSGQLWWVAMP